MLLAVSQEPVLLLDMCTPERPKQRLDVPGQQGLCCSWICLDNRSLCST
jgi:hypothetical protein